MARLEIELAQHGGDDNGKLPTTFDQFEEYGIGGRRHIAPAIREVVALGFVEVTERGRAGNAEWRRPSVYRLTYRPTRLTEATDDWRKIETIEDAVAIAAAARNEPPAKTKVQYPKGNHTLVPKRNRSEPFHGSQRGTTSHGSQRGTTSISRGQSSEGEVVILAPNESPTARGPLKGQARESRGFEGLGNAAVSVLAGIKKKNRRALS